MMTVLGLGLLLVGCTGFGAIVLATIRVLWRRPFGEAVTTSFALGVGVCGWLMFWAGTFGQFTEAVVITLLAMGSLGCLLFRRQDAWDESAVSSGPLHPVLLALAGLSLAVLAVEAVSPPTDADSLAYHFALARDFAQAERIIFIPRAIDAAVPLLFQVTYSAAYLLGGEVLMTMWAAALAVATSLLLYTFARRWLDRNWSAALALVFATMPATVYGAGSGQVEIKAGLFVLVCCIMTAEAIERRSLRYALAAGLAAGFFMAAKYTGLLLAGSAGGLLLLSPRRWVLAPVFSVAALIAGSQWYGWNWLHTGDPVFPILRPILSDNADGLWSEAFHQWHSSMWNENEQALPKTVWSFVIYPIVATFAPPPAFDSARVGFGLFPLLAVPFAIAALWRWRDDVAARHVAWMTIAVLIFSALWFFLGASQRMRHFMPVAPPLLLALTIAAERASRGLGLRRALIAGLTGVILLQICGQLVYGHRYIRDWIAMAPRMERLRSAVSYFDAAVWVNETLPPRSLVVHTSRFLNYLLTVPYYNAHPTNQELVDLSPRGADPVRLHAQLCSLGATHALAVGSLVLDLPGSILDQRMREQVVHGFASPLAAINSLEKGSRTLGAQASTVVLNVYSVRCP